MKTGYDCTAYFAGDGLGNCDDECQWWVEGGRPCPCAVYGTANVYGERIKPTEVKEKKEEVNGKIL